MVGGGGAAGGGGGGAAGGGGGDEEDGGDDGPVKDDVESKVEKHVDESERVVTEVHAKLYKFKTVGAVWDDLGVGDLRVLAYKDGTGGRVLFSTAVGKVLLNAALYAEMGMERSGKNGIMALMAVQGEGGAQEFVKYMVRVKTGEMADALKKDITGVLPKPK